MWIYIYSALVVVVAYLIGRNARNNGYYFWRSFFFTLILGVVVLAIVVGKFK